MIKGLHHVAINVADFDAMLAFYTGVMGFEPITTSRWRDRPVIDQIIGVPGSAARQTMMWTGNFYLELFSYEAPAPAGHPPLNPNDRGYTHICIDVEDIEAEHARLTAAGMVFNHTPVDLGGLKSAYGRDPEGNLIEIQEIYADDHPQDYKAPRERAQR